MEYFAGLDVSMDETHICVVDRDGSVVLETKTTTSPAAIAAGLAKAPDCKRIVFETGRMAPMPLTSYSQAHLNIVARDSTKGHGKTLGFQNPAERFNECVASTG